MDVTSSDIASLKVQKNLKNGTSSAITTPVILEVFDDVSGDLVYTGSTYSPGSELPIDITKKI